MVGDLFHHGHVKQLRRVHELGYEVVVGIHSDEAAATYKRLPVLTIEERIAVIESCEYVAEVVRNAPVMITEKYLDEHNIDMVFHSHSLDESDRYDEMYAIPHKLGKFTRTEYTQSISTTDIINRIIDRFSGTNNDAIGLLRREIILLAR